MHGQMEGSLAKTVRIVETLSERIETSFPLLLLEKSGPDARCMDGVFIRHAACLLGCLLLCILAHGSSENSPRSSERNKGFEKNLRDGEKGLKREEISKTRPDVHLVSFNNSRSTIQLTFSHHKSVSLPGLQLKKLAASVAIIFLQHIEEFPN